MELGLQVKEYNGELRLMLVLDETGAQIKTPWFTAQDWKSMRMSNGHFTMRTNKRWFVWEPTPEAGIFLLHVSRYEDGYNTESYKIDFARVMHAIEHIIEEGPAFLESYERADV